MQCVNSAKDERYGPYRLCYLPRSYDRGRWQRRYRPDHDQQHCYHHAPTVKPEAAIAVVELLMMGVRTPETC